MSWKQEIFRAFILVFGSLQTIANLTYLLRKNGLTLARKQHQELPADVSDKKMKLKVTLMLVFGIAFFFVGLVSYIFHDFLGNAMLMALILFAVYETIEAAFYRYWKTTGAALVSFVMLALFLIV
ncbi:MAG: hypothetical protein N2484_14845 [Clostridia bacterium]|nr:hypothetical protein [Clostridia bacterium]